jgi:hypothetical protein
MFLAIGVHAAAELGRLVGVAGLAIHRRDLVGMLSPKCFPSTKMLWPLLSVMLESPWQVRQSCARRFRGASAKTAKPATSARLRIIRIAFFRAASFIPPSSFPGANADAPAHWQYPADSTVLTTIAEDRTTKVVLWGERWQ